ncbi:MAG TPA: ATP-binding protein [Xenococcaceae cyanobacterium]
MFAIPIPRNKSKWNTISFVSTLYLCPILDLLLAPIPSQWQAEIRLGLQEALVNAAKHGNQLDPNKTIIVKFTITQTEYCWIIIDEGKGFIPQCSYPSLSDSYLPPEESENGRGMCILQEVFDRVNWNKEGTELTLSKNMHHKEH